MYRKAHDPVCGNYCQLFLPQSLWPEILQALHSDVTAGHLGVHRTLDRLKARFYWGIMQDDVSRWCRECQKCQQRKTPHQKDCSPLQQYLVSAPVEHIALDILGLLPETYDGNHYTHVVGDYFF